MTLPTEPLSFCLPPLSSKNKIERAEAPEE